MDTGTLVMLSKCCVKECGLCGLSRVHCVVHVLLQYGANAKAVDHEGHNALYYARGANAVDCVELLRTQGCSENPTLPRRRISNPPPGGSGGSSGSGEIFDKLPASVI